ncbi:ankyrin repeat domain-containing protein [Candidatus Dependentiae bacterium]|nr:ankyrin repeat domain-containing protein [Candidatus Dependentiae bacterium]
MSKELLHLFSAIKQEHLEQVKVAIKNHPSLVNMKDDKGNTALLIAAQGKTTDILDTLIKHHASINYQHPKSGQTALMLAAQNGRLENVKYLLKHDANAEIKDAHGKTVADYAKDSDNKDLIALFVN